MKKDESYIFPDSQIQDSLEVLEENGYIKTSKTLGGGLYAYQITTRGFEVYANERIPDYHEKIDSVISAIVNQDLGDNRSIAETLGQEVFLVNHIMDLLEQRGFIRQAKMLGGGCAIVSVSASLRRHLNE